MNTVVVDVPPGSAELLRGEPCQAISVEEDEQRVSTDTEQVRDRRNSDYKVASLLQLTIIKPSSDLN